ncbi:hypothetical protein DIPPA_26714 [Diplonema papillatum]|nr:hypothetical protein DIPPA_26714 [Diplonema papillatum]
MAEARSKERRAAARAAAGAVATSDPLVLKWHKSKKQRAFEKSEVRKEKERKATEALARLAEQRTVIEQRKEAAAKEKKTEDQRAPREIISTANWRERP